MIYVKEVNQKKALVRDMTSKHTVTFLNFSIVKKFTYNPPPTLSQILYNGITLFLITITKKKI